MAITGAFGKKRESVLEEDTIMHLNKSGTHTLESGRTATVVTDERLREGDRVLIVPGEQNKLYIIGGAK
jgi:hypothetical protein